MRAAHLLETSRHLEVVAAHRRREDSLLLKQLESLLQRQFARQEEDVELLEQTISVAQLVAPEILEQIEVGERALLIIAREDNGQGAAFRCASRGIILAADGVALLPKRRR
jgi:transcription elongation GreA/GreB family factor